jgi:hypothetical protein
MFWLAAAVALVIKSLAMVVSVPRLCLNLRYGACKFVILPKALLELM